jgi:DNA-binding NarL/FixJ family response regulator
MKRRANARVRSQCKPGGVQVNVLPRRIDARPLSISGGDYGSYSPYRKQLSPRMVTIAEQILSGNSTTKGVAEALGISSQTVKHMLTVMYARLGVENRIGLVIKYRDGLGSPAGEQAH